MTEEITKIKPKFSVKEPMMYRVIYINDEVTSMEFVVTSLIEVFNHKPEIATGIMQEIHTQGSGVAALLPYEMAEQKGVEVTQAARAQGFPLVLKLEEDRR